MTGCTIPRDRKTSWIRVFMLAKCVWIAFTMDGWNFDLQQRAFEGGRRVKWSTQGSDGIPKQTAKRATQAVCRISPAALLDTLQKL